MIEIRIKAVRRWEEHKCYVIEPENGMPFVISVSDLINSKRRFELEWFIATDQLIEVPPKFDWKAFIREIMSVAVDEDLGDGLSPAALVDDAFREWVRKTHVPGGTIERCLQGFPVYVDGDIYFQGQGLARYLKLVASVRIDVKELVQIIRDRMGAKVVRMGSGDDTLPLFRVPCPEPWFDVTEEAVHE